MPAHSLLNARVVLQNLRPSCITFEPRDLTIKLRDGFVTSPMLTADSDAASIETLEPLEFRLLSEVYFPVPPHDASGHPLRFEPDLLEVCDELRLRVGCAGSAFDVACPFVNEAVIWKHYELINRDFCVFHDDEDS